MIRLQELGTGGKGKMTDELTDYEERLEIVAGDEPDFSKPNSFNVCPFGDDDYV